MITRAFPLALAVVYWLVVIHVLRDACPVNWDGEGPTDCIQWIRMPTPNPTEYARHSHYYEFIYFLPYASVAVVMTFIGCFAAPRLHRCIHPRSPRGFVGTAVLTLCTLVTLALISDLGGRARLWAGPMFFLHADYPFFTIIVLVKVLLIPSLLAGAIAAINKRIAEH